MLLQLSGCMRTSFCLAIAINVLMLLGYSVEAPSIKGRFPPRDDFPLDAVVVDGFAPLSTHGVYKAILVMGYIQTALSTVGEKTHWCSHAMLS